MIGWMMLALAALEWRIVYRRINSEWCGHGAMFGVLTRSNLAPMRYRVLAAWALRWLPTGVPRLLGYLAFKTLLIGLALWACLPLVGERGVLAIGVLMATTFEFDYWDCYAELLGVALCLSGVGWMVVVGALVWGLSRETVILAPALTWAADGPGWLAFAGPLTHFAVRAYQGYAPNYVQNLKERRRRIRMWNQQRHKLRWLLGWAAIWAVGPFNLTDVRHVKTFDVRPLVSVAWTLTLVWLALQGNLPMPFASTAWVALLWPLAAWTMARANETRIMLPCALWMASCFA